MKLTIIYSELKFDGGGRSWHLLQGQTEVVVETRVVIIEVLYKVVPHVFL